MSKSFYDLEVWQSGFGLLQEIYKITRSFPKFEQYALTSQMIRAANSVIANVAEAHGRFYYADKIRVFYIARAEINEVRSHLRVAQSQNYIDKETFSGLDKKYESLTMKLNSLISYFSNRQKNQLTN